MTCNDESFYIWNEMFSEHERSEEQTLAERYIMSVQTKEDEHIQDQKYWDYHNHVVELNSANGKLWDMVSRIHEKQRGLDYDADE